MGTYSKAYGKSFLLASAHTFSLGCAGHLSQKKALAPSVLCLTYAFPI